MTKAKLEELHQSRWKRLMEMMWHYKKDMAERLRQTRELFGAGVLAVDLHTHSSYSDGRGTVGENYERAMHAGLDFMFATDHESLGQRKAVAKLERASWGQEPGARLQHIGLLCNTKRFRPKYRSMAEDFATARSLAPFAWIPHPAGWYPTMAYGTESIESLWTLGEEFAVEVLNGAYHVVRAYDKFDARAVEVWDRLLCDGRRVTALGNSDAHCPDDIGTAWTGVFSRACTAEGIIEALRSGRCFASEAAMMEFTCDGVAMGQTVRKKRGQKIELTWRAADAAGIARVRVVSGGKMVKEMREGTAKPQAVGEGGRVWEGKMVATVKKGGAYFRLETVSTDDRRAFSTPVYVESEG